jgi:RNA polymerase sigma-70 factor, ECF subfamily
MNRLDRRGAAALRERRVRETADSDAELIASIAEGNLAALGAIYDRHHAPIRAFVIRATAGGPDADDLVQEVFLTLLKAAKTYDGRASARPFLIGIAAQLIRRRTRTVIRWLRALGLLGAADVQFGAGTPEDAAGVGEDLELLRIALARLSDDKRLVLLMIDGEGLSGQEVAEALAIPAATVRTRLHYGRAEIRRCFAKRRRT